MGGMPGFPGLEFSQRRADVREWSPQSFDIRGSEFRDGAVCAGQAR